VGRNELGPSNFDPGVDLAQHLRSLSFRPGRPQRAKVAQPAHSSCRIDRPSGRRCLVFSSAQGGNGGHVFRIANSPRSVLQSKITAPPLDALAAQLVRPR
jgi:hypothetical protein